MASSKMDGRMIDHREVCLRCTRTFGSHAATNNWCLDDQATRVNAWVWSKTYRFVLCPERVKLPVGI